MKNKIIIIFCCVLILFFSHKYIVRIGQVTLLSFSSYVVYPLLKMQQIIIEPMHTWAAQKKDMQQLSKAYDQLQKERELMQAEIIALKSLLYYEKKSEELLHFKKRYALHGMRIAQVLVRHLSDQNHFFLINLGSSHGVKSDMIAVHNNCLIGRVVEVYPWYSKVCLITDKECKVAASCCKTNATGILEGNNNQHMLSLQYVSHLNDIALGDTLISSGDGLIFPSGFGLGTIATAKKEALCYAVTVTPLVDFNSIDFCILCSKSEIECCFD